MKLKDINPLDKPTMSVGSIARKHKVDVKFIEDQLKLGIEVEKEHTSDVAVAREIALDHLMEVPDYYTKLKSVER